MYYDQDTRLAFKKAKKVRYWYIYFNCKKWINKILKYSLQNALIGVHFVCTLILTVGMKRQVAMILLISHRLILIEFFSANVVVLNCNSLLITSRIPCRVSETMVIVYDPLHSDLAKERSEPWLQMIHIMHMHSQPFYYIVLRKRMLKVWPRILPIS